MLVELSDRHPLDLATCTLRVLYDHLDEVIFATSSSQPFDNSEVKSQLRIDWRIQRRQRPAIEWQFTIRHTPASRLRQATQSFISECHADTLGLC